MADEQNSKSKELCEKLLPLLDEFIAETEGQFFLAVCDGKERGEPGYLVTESNAMFKSRVMDELLTLKMEDKNA